MFINLVESDMLLNLDSIKCVIRLNETETPYTMAIEYYESDAVINMYDSLDVLNDEYELISKHLLGD